MAKKQNYIYRQDGNTFVSDDVEKLVAAVQGYRSRNGLPGSDRKTAYADVTNHVTASIRKREDIITRNPPVVITFENAMKAARAAVKVATGDVVNEAELKRRADICHACPKKTESAGCFGCQASSRLANIATSMKRLFGKELKIPKNLKRFNCSCCGCSLSLILPTKAENLHEDTAEQAACRPDTCWLKKR
jgi:hypothetical protein